MSEYQPSPAMVEACREARSIEEVLSLAVAYLADPDNVDEWVALAKTIPMTEAEAEARMERIDGDTEPLAVENGHAYMGNFYRIKEAQ